MSVPDKRLVRAGVTGVQHNIPVGKRVDITAALLTIFRPEIEQRLLQRAKEKQCAALTPVASSPLPSE
jgi:hypothetical protein